MAQAEEVLHIPLLPEHWRYRTEGGGNLLLSYVGTEPSLSSCLLRVHKRAKDAAASLDLARESHGLYCGQDWTECQHRFTKQVMLPLMHHRFLHCGRLVRVTRSFLHSVAMRVQPQRQASRAAKTSIDESACYALLLDDLTVLGRSPNAPPVYCVEVKTKWGFLPPRESSLQRAHLAPPKHSVCRYCMFQHTKVSKGAVPCVSGYCPLDLFSRFLPRVEHALRQLHAHPQNNFRINRNGVSIQCLPESRRDILSVVATALCQSSVLDDIRAVQSLASCIDIEHVIPVFEQVVAALAAGSISWADLPAPRRAAQQSRLPCRMPLCGAIQHATSPCARHLREQVAVAAAAATRDTLQATTPAATATAAAVTVTAATSAAATAIPAAPADISSEGASLHLHQDTEDDAAVAAADAMDARSSTTPSAAHSGHADDVMSTSSLSSVTSDIYRAAQRVRDFLVASSARDCSLMVTLQPATRDSDEDTDDDGDGVSGADVMHAALRHAEDGAGEDTDLVFHYPSATWYSVRIAVVDMDPRPLGKIPTYWKQDLAIVANYLSAVQQWTT